MKNTRDSNGRFIKGIKTWNFGKKLSDEHKKKLSEAKLKNPVRYWSGRKRLDLNGSVRKRKDGYKYVAWSLIDEWIQNLVQNSYRKRPVPEHHCIWIKHHKMPIPKNHVIHHKNRVKDDNRIENLVLMSNSEHSKHHYNLYRKEVII